MDAPLETVTVNGKRVGIYSISNTERKELVSLEVEMIKTNNPVPFLVKFVFFAIRKGEPDLTEETLWKVDFFSGPGKLLLAEVRRVLGTDFRSEVKQ